MELSTSKLLRFERELEILWRMQVLRLADAPYETQMRFAFADETQMIANDFLLWPAETYSVGIGVSRSCQMATVRI